MNDPLYLGVDGGASRCCARLRDVSGNLLGEGVAGPANISTDIEQARASILEAVASALRAADLPAQDIARCHAGLGLAGGSPQDLQHRLLDGWNPFGRVRLASDAYVAWLGAHGGDDGAIVILGTGSVCFGQLAGQRYGLGGWGADISDEAGAATIGRESLRRSLWAWDGRIAMTPLAGNLLSMFGGSPDAMASAARVAAPADYAAWAPLVFQFAGQGDALAVAILRDAAEHVVRMIERLLVLGFVRIAMVGGIAAPMMPWLPEALRARLCEARNDALDGAIMMAQETPS